MNMKVIGYANAFLQVSCDTGRALETKVLTLTDVTEEKRKHKVETVKRNCARNFGW